MTIMKTPFLWSGSKDKDHKTILKLIPDFQIYHEPFLGGGSIYFRLLLERGEFSAFCSDINEELINTYEVIRDDPMGLISQLPLEKDKTVFQKLATSSPFDKTERAARFLYMNRNRFFGLGGWMTADRYARAAVVDRIRFFSPLMRRTTFALNCWDSKFDPNDFVFCDPPYPETNNSACYRINDDAMVLNKTFFDKVLESAANFLWITKHSETFHDHVRDRGVSVEIKEWSYRKPGKGVQQSFEIYVSRGIREISV